MHQGRSRTFAAVLVLSAILRGSATKLNYGWPSTSYRFPAPPTYRIGKRQFADDPGNFNWSSIQPSEELKWTPCYAAFGTFECARLAVPVDYSDPNGQKAAVAITKSPSKIPPGQKGYRGPILFSPGGPGSSGVQWVLFEAQYFREVLGDDFDLIGFDPRGIGFTTPGMFAFTDQPEEVNIVTNLQKAVNETSGSLGTVFAFAQTVGKVTKARIQDVAQHVSTPTVARDMLSIVKAFGTDKLQYWGVSYGSVLGATFAAMFPDNVGRLVIDGVVDSENYYKGQYGHELQDTDKVLLTIYQACVEAGPSICPIYDSTTDKISARVNLLLVSLKFEPISFYNETSGLYGLLDYTAAKRAIFTALYTPHQSGAQLTFALAAAERGEGQPLHDLSGRVANSNDFDCNCAVEPSAPFASGIENVFAIWCGDSGPSNATLDDIKHVYEEIAGDSQLGEMWSVYVICSGWKVVSKEQFSAAFNSTTSFPILLIGNTADPVTPLAGARKMSQLFRGSVLLTQDSPGHTSMSALSSCTSKAIRDYFREGKLPANGTVCSVESSVFGNATKVPSSGASIRA